MNAGKASRARDAHNPVRPSGIAQNSHAHCLSLSSPSFPSSLSFPLRISLGRSTFSQPSLEVRMALSEAPRGFLDLTVVRREDVTEDLAVFRFRSPEPLPFEPGQYVTLALPNADGRPVKRAYSIVSAPHEEEIELVIELVEHGELTPLMWPLAVGETIWGRRKIVGHFLLDAARTQHVMACTVTGIAPFLSMLRSHRRARDAGESVPDHRFLVLFGASRSVEHGPYRAEVEALAREGWVDDVLRKHLDRLGWDGPDTAGYACGNPDMIENVKGLLARAGLMKDHVHEEKYFTHHDDHEPVALAAPEIATPTPTPPTLPGQTPMRTAPSGPPSRPPGPPGGIVLKTAPRSE